eukprot:5163562-Amphidinium_carterae.1
MEATCAADALHDWITGPSPSSGNVTFDFSLAASSKLVVEDTPIVQSVEPGLNYKSLKCKSTWVFHGPAHALVCVTLLHATCDLHKEGGRLIAGSMLICAGDTTHLGSLCLT